MFLTVRTLIFQTPHISSTFVLPYLFKQYPLPRGKYISIFFNHISLSFRLTEKSIQSPVFLFKPQQSGLSEALSARSLKDPGTNFSIYAVSYIICQDIKTTRWLVNKILASFKILSSNLETTGHHQNGQLALKTGQQQ